MATEHRDRRIEVAAERAARDGRRCQLQLDVKNLVARSVSRASKRWLTVIDVASEAVREWGKRPERDRGEGGGKGGGKGAASARERDGVARTRREMQWLRGEW